MKYYIVHDTRFNWYLLCTYNINRLNLGEVFYEEIDEEEFNIDLGFCRPGGNGNDKE